LVLFSCCFFFFPLLFKMSKPRSTRPFFANAASKLPSSRKDDLSSKQKKISLGEKILRAGSEGNLVKGQVQAAAAPAQRKASAHKGNVANQLPFSAIA
jgi:hypothetical protein